ncbi:MAG: dolichyl-phosphate beta-D-mannosyltransferase [Flavobacteriaceae bacterium TMED179]|nr:MAG: dolichyl-phosphate beta-D-mannosyltransferase [Flavobacteriaceae bacterium TMED179]|tara:strand:- start:1915 stop:2631 length:717 start_codon:yes stop_codon:yes gene_type:complete
MKKTLIIIPTFNEIENISAIIYDVFNLDIALNILVVDDQSPDGTAKEVMKLMKTFPNRLFLENRTKKEGLGAAYVDGFRWALKNQYDYIFEMDADFSHQPLEIKSMVEILETEADVIIGSRYVKGVNVVNWPLSRVLLSYFASIYVRMITNMPVKDPTAGFVGYKRNVLEDINLDQIKFVGYAFQIELKYKAWIKRFKLKEHPIIFVNRVLGKSKMNGSIIWEALFGVIFLRLNKKKF